MKTSLKILVSILTLVTCFSFNSCDKVKNPYPPKSIGELDESLYPGNFDDYAFPVFTANANADRNVLIEDYTGHKCIYCPAAADTGHYIANDFKDRVFVSTIHTGPTGIESFQTFNTEPFIYNFTNEIGLNIGRYIKDLPSSGFSGNPKGSVSRVAYENNVALGSNKWRAAANALLVSNDLKVNLQSVINYFPATKGAFIHIEAEILDPVLNANNLGLVVAFMEDSIVKPQKFPLGSPYPSDINYDYVHRDLLKLHLNGGLTGTSIGSKSPSNGKYYFNYSFKIESPYSADNSHFLIYVLDKNTGEIYHVIKDHAQ
ncbi:MAG: Omp28-related outer membrane protein [Bacteroidetes bacterium]|nr:Omp28-related outer membrane protein [Bacteroidota bacterium]